MGSRPGDHDHDVGPGDKQHFGPKSKERFAVYLFPIATGLTGTPKNFSVFSNVFSYTTPYNSDYEVNRVDNVVRAMDHRNNMPADSYSINLTTKAITHSVQGPDGPIDMVISFTDPNWAAARTAMVAMLGRARDAVYATNLGDRKKLNALIKLINSL